MQKVKLFMRQVGNPDPALGVISVGDLEDELEKYTSQGFALFETHYLGEVRTDHGAVGFKVLFVLVKDEETAEVAPKKRESLKGA